jgi:hypothetical protein
MVSLGLGSDASNHKGLKTPGSFQTYLLFTMYSEQASVLSDDANFYFLKEDNSQPPDQFSSTAR